MPDAHRRLDKLKVLIDNKLISGEEEEYFGASYSGLACWAAARDVIYGRQDWTTTGESEQKIDPDDWDASFYASIAVTGSSGWKRNGVDHARQEFGPGTFTRLFPTLSREHPNRQAINI